MAGQQSAQAQSAKFDAATLGGILSKLDASLTTDKLAGMLKGAGADESHAVQNVFRHLGKILLGQDSPVSEADLPSLLKSFDAAISGGASGNIAVLSGLASDKLVAMANDDIGVRYALMNGLSFAISGSPSLYDNLNRDGSLYRFDPNTGERTYTDEWLKDRSQFMSLKASAGSDGNIAVNGSQSWVFEERNTDGATRINANADQAQRAPNKMIFATATTDTQTIVGGSGSDHVYSGGGDDLINAGAGDDYVEAGAGDDSVQLGGGRDTLSLGGGIRYEDLAFQRSGSDLKLFTGGGDNITLTDWYGTGANQSLVNLQVVADALGDFNPSGSDTLRNNRIEEFNFQMLVSKFDQAKASNSKLNRWNLMNSLLSAHMGESDIAAFGGDLAYQFGHFGSLANVSVDAAQSVLASAQLNVDPQQLHAIAQLQTGGQRLS